MSANLDDRNTKTVSDSERQLKAFVDATSDIIYEMGADWQQMLFIKGKDFLATTEDPRTGWTGIYIPEEEKPRVWETIEKAIQTQSIFELEHRVFRLDGSIGWTFSRAVPIKDDDGKIIKWFGVASDITYRKRREENLAFLAEISQNLAHLTSSEDTMRILGARIGEYFNLSRCLFAEVVGTDLVRIMSDWYRPQFQSMVGDVPLSQFVSEMYRDMSYRGEAIVVDDVYHTPLANGKELEDNFHILSFVNIPLLVEGDWRFILGIYDDKPRIWREDEVELLQELTQRIWTQLERTRTDEALSASEQKYRTLFNSIDEGFCTIEMLYDDSGKPYDYRFLEMNPAFAKQTGLENVAGKTILSLAPQHETFWFERYGEIARTGIPQRFEHQASALNRWFDVFAFRIGHPNDHKVAVLFTDTTQRKSTENALRDFADTLETKVLERTAELQKSESELQDSNRQLQNSITQLESFNHIASHDLQEPLRKIQIFASRLSDDTATSEKKNTYLAGINSASSRMRELIDDLLVYSRLGKGKGNFVLTDLNVVVDHVRSEFEVMIAEKKAVIESDDLPTIMAVPFEMRQLFANLISNSLKFNLGIPKIKISCSILSPDQLKGIFKFKNPGDHVEIKVSDNGIGFDNQYSEKIFGLFQRLPSADTFAGTGIGLSIVEKVMKDHGGYISASGEEGNGSVFKVYLPIEQKS